MEAKNMDEEGTAVEDGTSFADGFNSVANPTPTATPGLVQADEGEQTADVVQQAIEYAQITKAEYDELRARAAMIDEIKATQDKSFGTFGRTIKGMQDRITEFAAAPAVEVSQEDIDELRNEGFEPVANALEKIAKLRSISAGGGIDESKLEELVQARLAPALQKVETRLLAREHPDWKQIDQSPDFAAWVQAQPETYRQQLMAASMAYDSEFIGLAMTTFKKTRKPAEPTPDPAATRKSRLTAAVTPRGSGQAPASDPTSDFHSGFNSP